MIVPQSMDAVMHSHIMDQNLHDGWKTVQQKG
jgi:hypothetical protein